MLDPRIPRISKGDPIPADWLNQIVDALIRSIQGGKGIAVTSVGGRIVISAEDTKAKPQA